MAYRRKTTSRSRTRSRSYGGNRRSYGRRTTRRTSRRTTSSRPQVVRIEVVQGNPAAPTLPSVHMVEPKKRQF